MVHSDRESLENIRQITIIINKSKQINDKETEAIFQRSKR